MTMARADRSRGRSEAGVQTLVREARRAVRTARTWQHILEAPPREPWPDAELAMVRRIQPYASRR
jgi:hypothetical protein